MSGIARCSTLVLVNWPIFCIHHTTQLNYLLLGSKNSRPEMLIRRKSCTSKNRWPFIDHSSGCTEWVIFFSHTFLTSMLMSGILDAKCHNSCVSHDVATSSRNCLCTKCPASFAGSIYTQSTNSWWSCAAAAPSENRFCCFEIHVFAKMLRASLPLTFQLRHVSGAQQVIVQQVAAPQMVVDSGGQSAAGSQIRAQIVQHSPLPTQIVLAPASVQQTPQMVLLKCL